MKENKSIPQAPTINLKQEINNGVPNIATIHGEVGEPSFPSQGHIKNQNLNNISPSPNSKPNPPNKDQSKLFNETNIGNQIPIPKINETKEEQVQIENLNEYFSENSLSLKDVENHPHQYNFFIKSFQFLTFQVSKIFTSPKDMLMPYSKGHPIIKELQSFCKQYGRTEDDKNEYKQFIFYESQSGQKFVLKRSSFNISLKDKNDRYFSELYNHYIPEKYLEYSLSKLFSASPHGVFVYFFNIIFLENISFTVTEMLMEDGGTQLTENYLANLPEVERSQRIYDFFIQMNDCLAFLEQFRIEHNDIKLENVLENKVNKTFLYKLIDFDIGNNQSVTCKLGNGMGLKGYSYEYVAPEIIQLKNAPNNLGSTQINPWKAQIYSLGIIILKLIGFFKNTKIGIQIDNCKKSKEEHKKLLNYLKGYNNQLTDKLSKTIITICEKCIEYDPINRPSSSDLSDLLKDLTPKNSNTNNEEFKKLQNESTKTCKDQSTKVSNENNKELNEQKALNNSNSKIIDELKNQIQLMQEENLRIKLDNQQELAQQNKLSEEKVRKAKDCSLERIKTIESDNNNKLKHLLENPEIFLKHLISNIGMESNTKTDLENISKFLNNLINKKRYPYRLFLVDESKMKINTLINPNLFIDNSKKFLNIQVKFEYTFANPLDKLTLKSFVDFFYNLGFLTNQNIITVEELKEEEINFQKIQTKMKEVYSNQIQILQKEIYTKFKANIIENSRAPKHFIGELKYGAPQNLGNLIYENGTIYQTKFSDGKIDNYCLISKGYNLYLGFFDPNFFSGFGCCLTIDPKKNFIKEDMDLHFGYFNNLTPEGHGIKKIAEGTFIGNWSRGFRSGKGTFIYNDKRKLTGEWKLDQIIGEGTFESSNKEESYKGTFENGGFKYGEYTYSDGTSYYGEWKEFKRNGYGKLSFKDKSFYEGEFKNDERHGQGKFVNPNFKLEEKGVYENDCLNGEGEKHDYIENIHYKGSFKNNKFEGKGKIVYPDKSYYEGEFKKNKKHGQGMEVGKTNVIIKGKWNKGEFISE